MFREMGLDLSKSLMFLNFSFTYDIACQTKLRIYDNVYSTLISG